MDLKPIYPPYATFPIVKSTVCRDVLLNGKNPFIMGLSLQLKSHTQATIINYTEDIQAALLWVAKHHRGKGECGGEGCAQPQ